MRHQNQNCGDGPVKIVPAIEHNPAPRLRDRQSVRLDSLGVFLRARPELLREWMLCRQLNLVVFCVVAIAAPLTVAVAAEDDLSGFTLKQLNVAINSRGIAEKKLYSILTARNVPGQISPFSAVRVLVGR